MSNLKSHILLSVIFFNNPVLSDSFDLVCDVQLDSTSQGRYRFDIENKTVSKVGYYIDGKYTKISGLSYKTIGWNLEQDMLVWVANKPENFHSEDFKPARKNYDLIVFDLRNMNITFSRISRNGGLLENTLNFSEDCNRD